MENQQAQTLTEAAQKFVKALADSYESYSSADRPVSVRQINAELTIEFLSCVIDVLRTRAQKPESSLDILRESADQHRRQREATQALMRESIGAYAEFTDFMFSYYWRNVEEPESSSEE
jgi:hypothetical protein